MKIYPAIDIKDGKCVRLRQGEMGQSKVYGDPIEMALRWQDEGSQYLHVVDLDAAVTGGGSGNREIIRKMVESLKIPVQLGGGVRTREDIVFRLDELGISRVIIGTAAIYDLDLVDWALSNYGTSRIAIGLDARDGKLVKDGWTSNTDVNVVDLANKVHDMGVNTVIFTDITKDGMMSGPDLDFSEQIVRNTWMNLIVSGGISTLEDIDKVKGTGACGCIIGKALYEGAFTLQEALAEAK